MSSKESVRGSKEMRYKEYGGALGSRASGGGFGVIMVGIGNIHVTDVAVAAVWYSRQRRGLPSSWELIRAI